MRAQVRDIDCAIVGAGPVGTALAVSLAQQMPETAVMLIDQRQEQMFDVDDLDTRVFALNMASSTLLKNLGVWHRIDPQRRCIYRRMHVWDAQGTGAVDFACEDMGIEQLGHILEVGLIQNALDEAAAQLTNLQVVRPATVTGFACLNAGVRLNLHCEEANVVLHAGLLCAADGVRSALRRMAGIDSVRDDCRQQALVANVEIEVSHEDCASQVFLPTGPLAFLPLADPGGNRHLCSIVWSMDDPRAEQVRSLTDLAFVQELSRATEGRFGAVRLLSDRSYFPLIQQHARTYTRQGMVLVGDAAHRIHPLAGLGANLGFQDVAVLCRELVRARERGIPFAHPSILARYQRQRRLDNEIWLRAMRYFRLGFADLGIGGNALRNLGMRLFSKMTPLKNSIARQAIMES